MRKIIVFSLLIICFACKTTKIQTIEEGRFIKPYDYIFVNDRLFGENELVLNKDSTFSLELEGAVVICKCQGKWYYLDDRTIYLKCDEPYIPKNDTCKTCMPFDPSWAKGYMKVRERKVKVINANKIKLELPEPGSKKYMVMKKAVE